MVKQNKNLFFQKALRLNLGIQHLGLKVYQSCKNAESRTTFDLFMVWSYLCPSCLCSTERMGLVLLFIALWFILRGDMFYVLHVPCVILFLYFSVLLALRLPGLGKRELILVLFVRLFDLCLFGFVGFLFLLVSGKCCGL